MNERKIPTPDAALHDYFCDNEVFADLFNTCVFGKETIQPEDLRVVDSVYSETVSLVKNTEKLGKYRDIIRKVTLGAEFVILGVENQDKIHYAMPIRVMLYDVLGYSVECKSLGTIRDSKKWTADEFLSKVPKGTKLTPIVTIVFYTGEEKWDGPRSIHEMLDISEALKGIVANYPIYVVDVGHDDVEFRTKSLQELTYTLRAIYNETAEQDLTEVSSSIISLAGILSSTNSLYDLKRGGKMPMCKATERMIERGAIRKCLEKGRTCEEIAEFMDIPLEKVKEVEKDYLTSLV